ncbi:MAG TPA: hypothetical protein PKL73_11500 [Polyangiaceae bacterium]|nr:hypothetical protein [Polyangiaceae bacterium]HNZ21840.1 hypothetical protein [Polyangiaceae bacterium]HOD23889.1 hypothetical protein [Polyangiaceae bacterium]HOE48718.1 hypothetical protein [Polyangiaceae bacterium]HOG99599.1 hypothetical protein [Polyangiaceae bacterium]
MSAALEEACLAPGAERAMVTVFWMTSRHKVRSQVLSLDGMRKGRAVGLMTGKGM